MSGNPLDCVLPMNDRDVAVNDGVRIAVDRKLVVEFDAFLLRRHVLFAKKTWTALDGHTIHCRSRADNAMRNVPNVNFEPVDGNRPSLCARETFRAGGKQCPDFQLLLEKRFNLRDQGLFHS